jgi:hypothetical protein
MVGLTEVLLVYPVGQADEARDPTADAPSWCFPPVMLYSVCEFFRA